MYSRGYPSWTNDAANNLPISASKFDTEDNDFASGLNNCVTKDGLSTPSSALTWSLTSGQILQLNRGSDGNVFGIGRTGGSTNPSFKFSIADAGGLNISPGGGGLNIGNAGNLTVLAPTAGVSFTVTGLAGAIVSQFTSASGATTTQNDVLIQRAGSTANTIEQGPNLVLQDSTNATFSCLQQSGGQSEFWQYNAGAWNQVMKFTTSRGVVINAPASGNAALTLTGVAGSVAQTITGSSTSGSSFGLSINAGTSSADYGFLLQNQAASSQFVKVNGVGNSSFAATTTSNAAGGYAMSIQAPTSGNSFGLLVSAGVAGTDVPFQVNNAANTTVLFSVQQTGALNLSSSSASSATAGTASALPSLPVGYLIFNLAGTGRKIPFYAL